MLHVLLPALAITVLFAFQCLEFYLKGPSTKPIKPSTLLTKRSAEEVACAEASQDLSDYHEVYQRIIQLRARLERTNSPATFVEHAKIGRELNKLEREYKTVIYPQLTPAQREKHDQHAKGIGSPLPINTTLLPPGVRPQDLPPPQSDVRTPGLLGMIPKVQGYNRFLPAIKILVLWAAIHVVVGWRPALSTLPLFTFPSQMFWPLARADGKIRFPLSLLFNSYSTPMPRGGAVRSMAFTTSVFVINKGLSRFYGLVKMTIASYTRRQSSAELLL